MSKGFADDGWFNKNRGEGPRSIRTTMALDEDALALLRVACAEWAKSQGAMVGLALRFFFATGAGDAQRVRINETGEERIAAALERSPSVLARPILDPEIHGRHAPADSRPDAEADADFDTTGDAGSLIDRPKKMSHPER
jgi:hypothetical protein